MTDANFDVEKHLSENVIRPETDTVPQTSGTSENQPNKPENAVDFVPKPLESESEVESDETLKSDNSAKTPKPKTKAQKSREQVLQRYSTVSVPKVAKTTRSGRNIKAPEKLNLSASSSD